MSDWQREIGDRMSAQDIALTVTGEHWSALSVEQQQMLHRAVTAVRGKDGREAYQRLSGAIHDRYGATPSHASLTMCHSAGWPQSPQVMAIMQISNPDGTMTNQLLSARFVLDPRRRNVPVPEREIEVTVEGEWLTWHEEFWRRIVAETDPARRVVMDHEHWTIGDENASGARGYGGRKWTAFFHDGRVVHTRNLWHQGIIPPAFREQLPDNAILVSGHHDTRPEQS